MSPIITRTQVKLPPGKPTEEHNLNTAEGGIPQLQHRRKYSFQAGSTLPAVIKPPCMSLRHLSQPFVCVFHMCHVQMIITARVYFIIYYKQLFV